MAQKNLFKHLLFSILFMYVVTVHSQNLILTLTNASTETFPVSSIQSIKFGTNTMILNENNGTINTWLITDIDNYRFDASVSMKNQIKEVKEQVTIYPNPSTDLVNIKFNSGQAERITIEIIDLKGSQIQQLFSGSHKDGNQYNWSPINVSKGWYYCKITTSNKVIMKSIIIQ